MQGFIIRAIHPEKITGIETRMSDGLWNPSEVIYEYRKEIGWRKSERDPGEARWNESRLSPSAVQNEVGIIAAMKKAEEHPSTTRAVPGRREAACRQT